MANIFIVKNKLNTITDNTFIVPSYNEYLKIFKYNYKVVELKHICKEYKIKKSGNKNELKTRIYNFLFKSYHVFKIQNCWKKYLLCKCNKLKGLALFNRKICVNNVDFLTMEEIKDISYDQFFSFTDITNQTYGFNILSLYNLFNKNKQNSTTNPYNRQLIPTNVHNDLKNLIKKHKLCGIDINICIEKPEEISDEQKIYFKTLEIFQEIDNLGNYTDVNWFNTLEKNNIIKFLRELYDIWNWRASLSNFVKREICPPIGNPFINIDIARLPLLNILKLKKQALRVMENIVTKGVNHASKTLGANYVLCALTLVSSDAANNLPWLYQSVSNN